MPVTPQQIAAMKANIAKMSNAELQEARDSRESQDVFKKSLVRGAIPFGYTFIHKSQYAEDHPVADMLGEGLGWFVPGIGLVGAASKVAKVAKLTSRASKTAVFAGAGVAEGLATEPSPLNVGLTTAFGGAIGAAPLKALKAFRAARRVSRTPIETGIETTSFSARINASPRQIEKLKKMNRLIREEDIADAEIVSRVDFASKTTPSGRRAFLRGREAEEFGLIESRVSAKPRILNKQLPSEKAIAQAPDLFTPGGRPGGVGLMENVEKSRINVNTVKEIEETEPLFVYDFAAPTGAESVAQAQRKLTPVASVIGAKSDVKIPTAGGYSDDVGAKYALVESDDLIPSHEARTKDVLFKQREDYPVGVQERAYHTDKGESGKVIRWSSEPNERALINNVNSATEGPPIIDARGVVLGGNGRSMIIQRMYDVNNNAGGYVKTLRKEAAGFGIDPAEIDRFEKPVLVRLMDDVKPEEYETLVHRFNVTTTQVQGQAAAAVATGKEISPSSIGVMAEQLAPDETVRKFLGDDRSRKFLGALEDDGVINPQNMTALINEKTKLLTDEGKLIIEKALMGKVVKDKDLLDIFMQGGHGLGEWRIKVESAVPQIIRAESHGGALVDDLQKALAHRLQFDAASKKGQVNILEQEVLEGRAGVIFNMLENGKQKEIRETFSRYADLLENEMKQEGALFDIAPSGDPFEIAFEKWMVKK